MTRPTVIVRVRWRLASYAVLGAVVALGASCSSDDGPDTSTPQAACESVVEALDLLASGDPKQRDRGVDDAEQIWVEANENPEVANGMRRECGMDVINMLDASGVPMSALGEHP